jgi:hypothetical protein
MAIVYEIVRSYLSTIILYPLLPSLSVKQLDRTQNLEDFCIRSKNKLGLLKHVAHIPSHKEKFSSCSAIL